MPVVDALIQEQINSEVITGAVLAVGHDGHLVHQKAFGYRAVSPRREPMTLDTVFDLASLTKVVATAPSVMRLVQYGQVRLEDPVARLIPEFAANGKDTINIRQLLTHFSGLKPDLDLSVPWEGREAAFHMANNEKLQAPQGSQFVYSDINFIVLGELVERLSGMTLDKYADAHIFEPLGMKHTRFVPPAAWRAKIAETLGINSHQLLRGTVQDPTAQRMGGVAGDAGVFSTAGDLALYAQALIDRKRILAPDIIEKMTTPQQPPSAVEVRGLGWDIDSPFSSNRGALLPVGSFGHTGFTGTSMWIDPYTNTYIILLTNSVHQRSGPLPMVSLRSRVATAVAAALNLDVTSPSTEKFLSITGYSELAAAGHHLGSRNGHVLTGIDVLEQASFAALQPQTPTPDHVPTFGLLTNQTGIDGKGNRTIDALAAAPGIKLAAIFSPEHGIFGTLDTLKVDNGVDTVTGIPIYSIYGGTDAKKRPPMDVLKTLDAVLIDMQDAGARFYTYETTVGYMLEAAAEANVEIIVLDRPDPVTGSVVQGPLSDPDKENFNNYYPVPVRHGMTLGELAQFFNGEKKIGARLRVIPMQGWLRGDWFDSTGIVWVNPSPNLRSVNEAALYPGVAMIEGANVSVGRGTDTPFEVVGAPWIKPREFADYLNSRLIAGVRFVPVTFTPTSAAYSGQVCGGVNLIVTDRNLLDSPEMGVELAAALKKLYPDNWKLKFIAGLLANQRIFDAISNGDDPRNIAQSWQEDLNKFRETRSRYLLYR
ncbi:MAG TPA: exo-beta-N-acetylmuramidase NamZ domain-containing protein [Candidatus Angelobacter sp.]|nr:exo-beta-N-acetylmuramidase NamZ domain-containing protein [Candidatus Angelobacter sp.]